MFYNVYSTAVLITCIAFTACDRKIAHRNNEEWVSLFNGKDLSGWNIKIKGHPVNENFKNTFRVRDGMLSVVYDDYQKFDNQFGHIFTDKPYSWYKLRLQYRFIGENLSDAPMWAAGNNGIMLHSQSAVSMELKQYFPVSLEFLLLCANRADTLPLATGSVCTLGTHFTYRGNTYDRHIMNSRSKSYPKNEWVEAVAEVYGDSLIRHIINGDTVLTYTDTRIGDVVRNEPSWPFIHVVDSMVWINKANTPLKEGYIALQAESQPIDFRKIELLTLVGCMDKLAKNYRGYYVKSDNSKCEY